MRRLDLLSRVPTRLAATAGVLLVLLAAAPGASPIRTVTPAVAAAVPTLTDTIIQDNLSHPWDLAFAPDGRMFLSERGAGAIKIFPNASPGALPLSTFPIPNVQIVGEGGALGLVLDPGFATNGLLYVCATRAPGASLVNQVLKLHVVGNAIDPASLVVIVDGMDAASFHDGCRIRFGPDGKLWVTMGDAGNIASARDPASRNGKVLRVNPDGSVPVDNPFANSLMYTMGHRNPQGIAFHPPTGKPLVMAHAHHTRGHDTIAILTAGADYGWGDPAGDGPPHPQPAWGSNDVGFTRTLATSGGTFVTSAAWSAWQGSLFVAALGGQRLVRFDVDAGATTVTERESLFNTAPPAWAPSRLRQPVEGPDGSLYLLTDSGTDLIVRITPSAAPPPPRTSGRYQPLTPARILDTRDGTGGFSAPLGTNQTIDVQVAGQGGVPPSGGLAAVMNVTATGSTAAGFLTIYPTGTSQPLASNLNFTAQQTVPNLVQIPLGTAGKVTIFNSGGPVHIVADVAGWVATAAAVGPTVGLFEPLAPLRLLDTRDGTGGFSAPITAGQTIDLSIAGRPGLPAGGISAVVLNVTATGPTAAGFLTLFPSGSARPATSNVNFVSGQTVANRAIVKVGAGKVSLFNALGTTNVVVDIGGWFTDGSQAAGFVGLEYTGLSPSRILDTRPSGSIGPNQAIGVQVTGIGGVPPMSTAPPPGVVVLNVTATAATGESHLRIYPSDVARPLASDLNFLSGQTVPNLVVVQLGADGRIFVYNFAANVQVVIDVMGWFS